MLQKIKNNLKKYYLLYEIVFSLLLAVGVLYGIGEAKSYNYLLCMFLYVAVFVIVRYGLRNYKKRRLVFSAIYNIPFCLLFFLGKKIVYGDTSVAPFSLLDGVACVSMMILFVLLGMSVLGFIDKKCDFFPKVKKSKKINRKSWLFYSIVIFLCWLPVFLIFFPGQVSVDSAVMIGQIIGETSLSNWHPVFYVFLISFPIKIGFSLFGDLTFGIALAVVLQMIMLAGIFGYVSYWCVKKTGSRLIGVLFVVFFAVCPVISCYSITLWKDVLFSAVFLLLIIKTYDFINKYKKNDKITFRNLAWVVILAILVSFLRNGGWLIVVALGIAMFLRYKFSRKVVGPVFSIVVVTIIVVQSVGYQMIGIKKSPFMESMSIPAQQMSYVASLGELSDKEKEELSDIADVEEMALNYSPMNADPAKNSFNYDAVEENRGKFLGSWWNIMLGHLPEYMKAYLLHMYSYWYVQGYSWSLSYEHNHDDLWLHEDYDDVPLLGAEVRNSVERIGYSLMETGWFGWIGNVGVVFWLILLVTLLYIYRRRYELLVLMVCPLTYIASLFVASPVAASFRYVYSLMLMLPILFMICFMEKKRRRK